MTYIHKLARRLSLIRNRSVLPAFVLLPLAAACLDQGGLAPDTSQNSGGVSRSVVVSPHSVTVYQSQGVRLTAQPEGSVSWSASGGNIDSRGFFLATAPGQYRITAERSGSRDTASITVVPPQPGLQSVRLLPATALLAVGAALRFQAAGTIPGNDSVPIGVVWSATGGRVGVDGTYQAGDTPGTYQVIARNLSGAQADTAVVTVSAPAAAAQVPASSPAPSPAPPVSSSSVALTIYRFDNGGAGSTLVSNGIPLVPGMLFPGQGRNVHIMVGGADQPVYVEELQGRYPDGSLRAILVQFVYSVSVSGTPATLAIGEARTAPDRAKTPVTWAVPPAAALPSSPQYLTATRLAGPLNPMGSLPAAPLALPLDEQDFPINATRIWNSYGAEQVGIAQYERGLMLYEWWLRTADPVWWSRANQVAAVVQAYALEKGVYLTIWKGATETIAMRYWATGDPQAQAAISSTVATFQAQGRKGCPPLEAECSWYWIGGPNGDDRAKAKIFGSAIDAYLVGATYSKHYAGLETVQQNLTDVLGTQHADGSFGGEHYLGGQKNYMVGMLLSQIIRYYEVIDPDPRIPPAVKRAIDYMWATQWVPSAAAFKYISVVVPNEGGTGPEPGLNGLIVGAFGWYYAYSGDPAYQDEADQILQGGRKYASSWYGYPMQFDQAYYGVFNYFAWRARVQ